MREVIRGAWPALVEVALVWAVGAGFSWHLAQNHPTGLRVGLARFWLWFGIVLVPVAFRQLRRSEIGPEGVSTQSAVGMPSQTVRWEEVRSVTYGADPGWLVGTLHLLVVEGANGETIRVPLASEAAFTRAAQAVVHYLPADAPNRWGVEALAAGEPFRKVDRTILPSYDRVVGAGDEGTPPGRRRR